jgi:flagellin-like hook-associated protein FlgL
VSIENWIYKALNPVMTALLRSPLHGIALLHFRGRKSGREFVTPLSYTRENDTVRFLSAHSTRWWMNLRGEPVPVSIEIARDTYTGKARLWDGDSKPLREGVRRFLTALPHDAKVYGINTLSVTSLATAQSALTVLDSAIATVGSLRGSFGTAQNRLESTIRTLAVAIENTAAAESRIRDVDFASETAKLTRNQVLQQAGVSVLGQANVTTQRALSLLN